MLKGTPCWVKLSESGYIGYVYRRAMILTVNREKLIANISYTDNKHTD